MQTWLRKSALALCAALLLTTIVACQKREQRTVQIRQETHEGEVQDVGRGEMVVE